MRHRLTSTRYRWLRWHMWFRHRLPWRGWSQAHRRAMHDTCHHWNPPLVIDDIFSGRPITEKSKQRMLDWYRQGKR